MKRKNNRKPLRVYRLEHFENFSKYGLEGFPPLELINKASEFIRDQLNAAKYKLRVDPKEIDFIADEMARMALAIQAFAINALKIFPFEGAPVNILDYKGIEFKKVSFLTETEFEKIKKEDDKYFDTIDKLYYLSEIDPTLVRDISIKIELNKSLEIEIEKFDLQGNINALLDLEKKKGLSEQERTELRQSREKIKAAPNLKKLNHLQEKITIPRHLHTETINSLTKLIEKLTGQIAAYSDLNARKDRALKIIFLMSMDAILAYLREYIYPKNRGQKAPTDQELQIGVLILVAAGILPTEDEYPKSKFNRKNGTRPVRKRYIHRILKETKEIPRNRAYLTRMVEILKEIYEHEKETFYNGDSGYFNIHELLVTNNEPSPNSSSH